jgi:hypothetical protein
MKFIDGVSDIGQPNHPTTKQSGKRRLADAQADKNVIFSDSLAITSHY